MVILAMADEPQGTLFGDAPDLEGAIRPAKVPAPGVARVLMPNRTQVELRPSDLESLLPEGHRARLVWDYVERADLSRIEPPRVSRRLPCLRRWSHEEHPELFP